MGGIWDSIKKGEVPSLEDVGESAARAADYAATGADEYLRANNPVYNGLSYMHFEMRDRMNNVGDPSAQPTAEELAGDESVQNENGWTRVPDWQAKLHQDESTGHEGREAKFVHEDGRESVRYVDRDEDGNETGLGEEVTRDDIRGTYNYVNPGNWEEDGLAEYGARMIGHTVCDVIPWYLGGSVRGDG